MGRYVKGLIIRTRAAQIEVVHVRRRAFFLGLLAGLTVEYLTRHLLRL